MFAGIAGVKFKPRMPRRLDGPRRIRTPCYPKSQAAIRPKRDGAMRVEGAGLSTRFRPDFSLANPICFGG